MARTVQRDEVVSQTQLAASWQAAASRPGARAPQSFIKPEPIAAYRIPDSAKGLADLPAPIRENLGRVDNTRYTDADIVAHRGEFVSLQRTDDGRLDPYLSTDSAVRYQSVPADFPGAGDALAGARAAGLDGSQLTVIRKAGSTQMMPASQLGVRGNRAVTVEAPWGGTQKGEVGTDPWIVRNGDEFYMVQAEPASGLPIAYIRDPAAPPARAATPSKSLGVFGI